MLVVVWVQFSSTLRTCHWSYKFFQVIKTVPKVALCNFVKISSSLRSLIWCPHHWEKLSNKVIMPRTITQRKNICRADINRGSFTTAILYLWYYFSYSLVVLCVNLYVCSKYKFSVGVSIGVCSKYKFSVGVSIGACTINLNKETDLFESWFKVPVTTY